MSTSLHTLVSSADLAAVERWLDQRPPHEIADALARIDGTGAIVAFRLLDKDRALSVFEELEPVDQQMILAGLRDHAFRDLVEGMEPDNRARMLSEAPATVAKRVLEGLSATERQMTAELLGYPPGSAGQVMSPEVLTLSPDLTVDQAMAVVRERGATAETVYVLAVVDDGRVLRGTVELRDLVMSAPDRELVTLLGGTVYKAAAIDSAEQAARLMAEANLIALPIVDSEDRLVGLLTIDDAMEIIEAADTEDTARQTATTPWAGHYMAAGVGQVARMRAPWLLLLIVASVLTVNVLQIFEDELTAVTSLALFIPLLVGTGGNAGSQAATTAVRAIAVGEVRGRDLPALVWRELRIGVLLGSALGAVGLVVGGFMVGWDIAVVVGLSLIAVCTWAAVVGATMPLVARRLRIDPAVISAPLVTTLVDATGLVMYFLIARMVLDF